MKSRRVIAFAMIFAVLSLAALFFYGCGKSAPAVDTTSAPVTKESVQTVTETSEISETTEADVSTTESSIKENTLKLYINDREIPVTWENNDAIAELTAEVTNHDIIVSMSMYSTNEQVGPLGKSYTANDTQTTTQNGDIVLYNSSNIVVFYAPNTWAYTRLGKMDLSENEVTDLLSNGDVVIKLTK